MSFFRLSDTAVTPSDCWMQNATVSEYDRSLPSRVMSVPCSVVITRGTPKDVLTHPRVVESYLGTQETVIRRSGRRARTPAKSRR